MIGKSILIAIVVFICLVCLVCGLGLFCSSLGRFKEGEILEGVGGIIGSLLLIAFPIGIILESMGI